MSLLPTPGSPKVSHSSRITGYSELIVAFVTDDDHLVIWLTNLREAGVPDLAAVYDSESRG